MDENDQDIKYFTGKIIGGYYPWALSRRAMVLLNELGPSVDEKVHELMMEAYHAGYKEKEQ